MNSAAAIALSVLRSKWFWIAIALLIAVLLIRKHWTKISAVFARDMADYSNDPELSDQRKAELVELAQQAHAAIYGAPGAFGEDETTALQALNNTELKFLAKHYRTAITRGAKLSEDINSEWMPFNTTQETLVARLKAMNE